MAAAEALGYRRILVHTVQAGETLTSIARLHGVQHYSHLVIFNGLGNTHIRIGQELLIPPQGWTP